MINVTCVTSSSNPPANVRWTVDGRESTNAKVTYSSAENGGSITTSILELEVPSRKEDVKIFCYGDNPRTGKNAIGSRNIQVHCEYWFD